MCPPQDVWVHWSICLESSKNLHGYHILLLSVCKNHFFCEVSLTHNQNSLHNISSFSPCYSVFSITYEMWTSLVAQMMKCLPTVRETRVPSLSWEDPLEKEMATHSSTLAWKIPWMEEHGRLQSVGSQRVGHDWATSLNYEIMYVRPRIRAFVPRRKNRATQ